MRLLTPRLYSQVAEGRPSSLTFAALSGFLGVRGEEMLRVLPEQATVSSFGVLMATVSLLKQWDQLGASSSKRPGKRPAPLAPNSVSHTLFFSPSP